MGVFLRLGNVELLEAKLGDHLAQPIGQLVGREDDGDSKDELYCVICAWRACARPRSQTWA